MTPRHPSYATLVRLEERLPLLAMKPIQLIWGMRDWCFTPAMLIRFQKIFAAAETHPLLDCGHYVVEDAHERIIPLVDDFLRRHPLLKERLPVPADQETER